MKGLLKGIRYISNMFDEKEPEMQIGLPTDVKHVAHIGIDGASANKPSWMGEFSSAPELSSAPINGNVQAEPTATGNRELPPLGNEKQKKQRRKQSVGSDSSPGGSPKGTTEKHSRRQRGSSNLSTESPGRDSCNINEDHQGRRHQKSSSRESSSSNRSSQQSSSSQELPDNPKRTGRRKKTKDSSSGGGGSGGSSTSSNSKGPSSLPDIMELQP